MKNFDLEKYLDLIKEFLNFDDSIEIPINQLCENFLTKLHTIVNNHAPMRK